MRVIAGTKKGIDLRCGRGPHFRPTAQVVKGSIFDTIGPDVAGATFVDLFAGSGSVGIEALSRGASHAVFVEQDHRILRALRTNIERCGFGADVAEVRMGDAVRFLERVIAAGVSYDIIFADPPYAGSVAQRVVDVIDGAGEIVCRSLIIEHGGPVFAREHGRLELVRTRHFGQTAVSYFRRKEVGDGEGKGSSLPGDV